MIKKYYSSIGGSEKTKRMYSLRNLQLGFFITQKTFGGQTATWNPKVFFMPETC